MKVLNKALSYLPIVIYFECIVLLFSVLFSLEWYLSVNNALEVIDFVLCVTMLLHALFKFRDYPVFAKSSFLTICILSIYHTIYYNFDLQNFDYYFFYITILASNLAYIIIREFIKP